MHQVNHRVVKTLVETVRVLWEAQMATQTRSLQPEDVKAFRKRILLNCGVDILESE